MRCGTFLLFTVRYHFKHKYISNTRKIGNSHCRAKLAIVAGTLHFHKNWALSFNTDLRVTINARKIRLFTSHSI